MSIDHSVSQHVCIYNIITINSSPTQWYQLSVWSWHKQNSSIHSRIRIKCGITYVITVNHLKRGDITTQTSLHRHHYTDITTQTSLHTHHYTHITTHTSLHKHHYTHITTHTSLHRHMLSQRSGNILLTIRCCNPNKTFLKHIISLHQALFLASFSCTLNKGNFK